eukprot:jgi/Botrbrau1/12027/Bobra.0293s0004.1
MAAGWSVRLGVLAVVFVASCVWVEAGRISTETYRSKISRPLRRANLAEVLFQMVEDEPAENATSAAPPVDRVEHIGHGGSVNLLEPVEKAFGASKYLEGVKETIYSEPRIDTDTLPPPPEAPAEVSLNLVETPPEQPKKITLLPANIIIKKRKKRPPPPVAGRRMAGPPPSPVQAPPSPSPAPSPDLSPPPPTVYPPPPTSRPPPVAQQQEDSPPTSRTWPPPAKRHVKPPAPEGPPPPPGKHKKSHKLQHLKARMEERLADAGVTVHD